MNTGCLVETHEWTEWADQPGRCVQVRMCHRCSTQEEREIPHEEGEVQWHPDNTYTQTCTRCGHIIDVSEERWEKIEHWRALEDMEAYNQTHL